MIDKTALGKIRKPNVWNTYKNPVDNLIHGILIQAISDAQGFIEEDKKYNNGDEALQYLDNQGRILFDYLLTCERVAESNDINKDRRYRAKRTASGIHYRKVV